MQPEGVCIVVEGAVLDQLRVILTGALRASHPPVVGRIDIRTRGTLQDLTGESSTNKRQRKLELVSTHAT